MLSSLVERLQPDILNSLPGYNFRVDLASFYHITNFNALSFDSSPLHLKNTYALSPPAEPTSSPPSPFSPAFFCQVAATTGMLPPLVLFPFDSFLFHHPSFFFFFSPLLNPYHDPPPPAPRALFPTSTNAPPARNAFLLTSYQGGGLFKLHFSLSPSVFPPPSVFCCPTLPLPPNTHDAQHHQF